MKTRCKPMCRIFQPEIGEFSPLPDTAQFIGTFAPTQATYSAFTSYLQNDGLTITNTYKHRMLIGFSGTVALAEQVFHVSINNYTSAKGEAFYLNTAGPLGAFLFSRGY